MANYFVSVNGSDITGDGLSVDTAWRTISYAAGQIPHGNSDHWNILIIEAGTYNEKVYFSKDYIEIIGDVKGEYFNSVGHVKVHYADGGSSTIITAYTTSLSEIQQIWENIWISSENGTHYSFTARNINATKAINCLNTGIYRGFRNVTCINCVAIDCANMGFYSSTTINCVAVRCSTGFYYCFYTNCIGICVGVAFRGGTSHVHNATNCIGLAEYAGAYYGEVKNCILTGRTPVSGCTSVKGTITMPYAYLHPVTYYDADGITSTLQTVGFRGTSSIKSLWESAVKFCKAFFDFDLEGVNSGIETDIEGLPFQGYDNGYALGTSRHNELSYANSKFTLHRATIKLLDLPCSGGVETTLTCTISSSGTTTRPQLCVYDADDNLIASDSAQSDEDVLEVTVTPDDDIVYKVWLYARDSASGAYTEFSDIKIDGVDALINSQGEIYPVLTRLEDIVTEIVPLNSHYKTYIRLADTYTRPESESAWNTFLSSFIRIGPMELRGVKALIEPDTLEQDEDGSMKPTLYSAKFNGVDLNCSPGNTEAYSTWDNEYCDILIVKENSGKAIIVLNTILQVLENHVGGKDNIELKSEKIDPEKDVLRDFFEIPD